MMNTKTTRITKKSVRNNSNWRPTLMQAATYSLTSSLIAPTLHAAQCNAPKNGLDIGVYRFTSAFPFFSATATCRSNAKRDRRRHRRTQRSQVLTTRPGETK